MSTCRAKKESPCQCREKVCGNGNTHVYTSKHKSVLGVQKKTGRTVRFNGQRAHAVLAAGPNEKKTRFTLISNRWTEKPLEPYCVEWPHRLPTAIEKRARKLLPQLGDSFVASWTVVDRMRDSDLKNHRGRPLRLRPVDVTASEEPWPLSEALVPGIDGSRFFLDADKLRGQVWLHTIGREMKDEL